MSRFVVAADIQHTQPMQRASTIRSNQRTFDIAPMRPASQQITSRISQLPGIVIATRAGKIGVDALHLVDQIIRFEPGFGCGDAQHFQHGAAGGTARTMQRRGAPTQPSQRRQFIEIACLPGLQQAGEAFAGRLCQPFERGWRNPQRAAALVQQAQITGDNPQQRGIRPARFTRCGGIKGAFAQTSQRCAMQRAIVVERQRFAIRQRQQINQITLETKRIGMVVLTRRGTRCKLWDATRGRDGGQQRQPFAGNGILKTGINPQPRQQTQHKQAFDRRRHAVQRVEIGARIDKACMRANAAEFAFQRWCGDGAAFCQHPFQRRSILGPQAFQQPRHRRRLG